MRHVYLATLLILSSCDTTPVGSNLNLIQEKDADQMAEKWKQLAALEKAILAKVANTEKGAAVLKKLAKDKFKLVSDSLTIGDRGKERHITTVLYEKLACEDNNQKIADEDKKGDDMDALAQLDIPKSNEYSQDYEANDLSYSLSSGQDNLFEQFKQKEKDRLSELEAEGCSIVKTLTVQFDRDVISEESLQQAKIISIQVGRAEGVFAALR